MISTRCRFAGLLACAAIALLPGSSLAQEPAPPLDRVQQHLNALESIGFSGFVLVAHDGRIVLQRGCGLADRANRIPYTGGTVSTIGSITKQFTAAAILQLVESERLRLDARLDDVLEKVPADKADITIHHLLTHTAGLGESPHRDIDPLSRGEAVAEALNSELLSKPGRRYRYSNPGYSILAAIVEKIAEEPYEVFLRRELLEPAGLFETGYVLPEHPPARLAHGYRDGQDQGTFVEMFTLESGPGWVLHGNGGILSTPYDMLRWNLALDRGVFSETLAPHLWTLPPGSVSDYGYGWRFTQGPGGRRRIQHNGGNQIFYADYHYYPDSKWFLFLMTNVAELGFEQTLDSLGRGIFGEEIFGLADVLTVELDEEARRAWSGGYRSDSGESLTLAPRGRALRIQIEGQDLLDQVTGADEEQRALHRERNRQTAETFAEAFASLITRNGPLRAHRILGTTSAWFHSGSSHATWVELELATGPTIRRLHWDSQGQLVGLGGSVYPAPVSLWAVPTPQGTLRAFHLERELPEVRLRPDREGGGIELSVRDQTRVLHRQ